MIQFNCSVCQRHLKAPDEGAGRESKCPSCGKRLLIPRVVQNRPQDAIDENSNSFVLDGIPNLRVVELPAEESIDDLTRKASQESLNSNADEDNHIDYDTADYKYTLKNRPESKQIILAFGFAFIALLILFIIYIYAIVYTHNSQEEMTQRILSVLLLFIVCLAVAFAAIAFSGTIASCPNCRNWWARRLLSKELIKQNYAFKTITRYDSHKGRFSGSTQDGKSFSGDTNNTTARQQQVIVLRRTFRNNFACKFCNHRWSSVTTEDSEDFDVEG